VTRGVWLFITLDQRGIALLRGDGAHQAVQALGLTATWSRFGRGWVLEHRHVPDVVAYAQSRHELAVVSNRREAAS